jgi:hypothetical protein
MDDKEIAAGVERGLHPVSGDLDGAHHPAHVRVKRSYEQATAVAICREFPGEQLSQSIHYLSQ